MKIRMAVLVLAAVFCAGGPGSLFAQGTAFTYQGQLLTTNGPAYGIYNFTFALYNARSGGSQFGSTFATNGVEVANGLFTVVLDFGPGLFDGSAYWMQLDVETNGAGGLSPLAPRQELTPTPYAIFAEGANAAGLTGTIPAVSLSGAYPGAVNLDNDLNSFSGDGSGLFDVNALTLDGLGTNNFWQTTGNAGTTAGPNYLGTRDAQALEIHVDGTRALRVEPGTYYITYGYPPIPNIIGGSAGNFVSPTSVGNFIGGGGEYYEASTNLITGENYNAIVGGFNNWITNGYENSIGGGANNIIGAYQGATVPGGANNIATGDYSFAAGQNAQALHGGAFVWADNSSATPFLSKGPNQFLIRAKGGVGIGTTAAPQQFLSVHGGMNIDQADYNEGFLNNGNTNGYSLTFGNDSGEGIASQRTPGVDQYSLEFYTEFANRMTILQGGNVGIGTTNPGAQLDVESPSTAPFVDAVYGLISSTTPGGFSAGVMGQNNGTDGNGIGVYGAQNGSGWGVYGYTPNGDGVYGYSSAGVGVFASTATGTAIYSAGNTRVTGLINLGSQTGTGEAPAEPGLVIRRVNSTATASNSVIAISDKLTLQRDGTFGGLQISYPASPGQQTIAAMGMDNNGNTVNFYTFLNNPVSAGVVQVYANGQNVHSCQITFGNTFGNGHLTQVNISRYHNDNYWIGTVNSTFNQ